MTKASETNNEISEFSFDFAEKAPHISRAIFGYLDGNNLLECLLVSKEWNKLIGTTSECMQKIKIVINKDTKPEAKEVLLASCREYQTLDIENADNLDQFYLDFFKKSEGHWKFVRIGSSGNVNYDDFISILKVLEPTIKKLSFHFTMNPYDVEASDFESLTFKNLEVLLADVKRFPLEIFARCKNLKLFHVSISDQHDVIRQLLIDNTELKDIRMGENSKDVFNDNLWRNVSFKLDHLFVRQLDLVETEVSPFIASFLKTQIETLKRLYLFCKIDLNSLEVIFRMRKLVKVLFILDGDVWLPNWNELVLHQNRSIESLQVLNESNNDVADATIINAFLRALPNIKELRIHKLNDDLFTYLSENVPNLESLTCVSFELSPARILAGDSLPILKRLEYLEYDGEDLQQLLAEPANNFQRLLRDFRPPVA